MMPTSQSPSWKISRIAVRVFVLLYFVVVLMINIFPFLGGQYELLDFGSFYASGLNLRQGENPYDPDSRYVLEIDFPRVGAGGKMVNLNPPISAMLFGFIARFDPNPSFRIWQLVSAVLFTGVIFLLTSVYKQNMTPARFVWAFTIAALWQTLTLGQIYVFLFLFVSLGWILLAKKSYVLAGIAIGLAMALKPNFMLWALFLLAAGYRMTFLASLVTSLLVSLIPVFFHGVEIYRQWLDASALERGTLILPGNSSLVGLGARLNVLPLGIVVSLVLVGVLLYWLMRRTPVESQPAEQVSALGIIAALLASPVTWAGYTMLLLPVFFSRKDWDPLVILSAAILTFPFGILLKLWQTSYLNFVIFGWFYGWGILALLGDVVRNTMVTNSSQTIWSTSSRKL